MSSTPLPPPSRERSPAPVYRRQAVRVACVQFDPKIGMVQENASKVERMLSGLQPGSVDLVVLPEMCLSGYMFHSPTSILPYLEPPRIGPTSLLARSIAKRLRCCVVAGYPEALPSAALTEETGAEDESNDISLGGDASKPPSGGVTKSIESLHLTTPINAEASTSTGISRTATPSTDRSGGDQDRVMPSSMKALDGEALGVGYNSAVVVDPQGEVVGNYRKTFRFETDKNWAREDVRVGRQGSGKMKCGYEADDVGDGFRFFDLAEPVGRIAVGICMDMNPKDFVAPWDAFELANFAKDNKCDMLVVPMNWLDPPAEPPTSTTSDPDVPPQDPQSPSMSNLNYWAARLTPLHDPAPGYGEALVGTGVMDAPPAIGAGAAVLQPGGGRERAAPDEVVFVACNRVGTELGTRFVGTSSVMTISSNPSRIELVECCNVSEERVMVATVT